MTARLDHQVIIPGGPSLICHVLRDTMADIIGIPAPVLGTVGHLLGTEAVRGIVLFPPITGARDAGRHLGATQDIVQGLVLSARANADSQLPVLGLRCTGLFLGTGTQGMGIPLTKPGAHPPQTVLAPTVMTPAPPQAPLGLDTTGVEPEVTQHRPVRKTRRQGSAPKSSSRRRKTPRTSVDESAGDDGDEEEEDSNIPLFAPTDKVSENLPVSPNEEFHTYADLIRKVALRLGIPTSQPSPPVEDVIFEVLQAKSSSVLALPISRVLLDSVKASWTKPASIPVSNKKLDHLYRIQEASAEFLFTHLKPNSVVVSSSSRSRRQHSTPPDREGKKMDAYGRRLYSIGALGIKSCDYEVYIARCIHSVFEDLSLLLQLIPEDSRQRAVLLCSKGLLAAKQSIAIARHTLEMSAKTLTTAVAIQRHSWLRSTSLSQEAKSAIEDLPFDGSGLFSASTDTTLQEIDKNIKTSRTLGVSSSYRTYRPRQSYGRPWNRRSYQRISPEHSWRARTLAPAKPPYAQRSQFSQPQQQTKPKKPRAAKQGL